MHDIHSYQVAGFRFTIEGPLPSVPNLTPFLSEEGENLFRLELVSSMAPAVSSPVFKTEDGPGFPEIANEGKGYLFLGKSGTGKSTHSSLWLKHIPGTELLNDDNPILRLMEDGTARVYGSPWSGKTPCYKNMEVPAGAVVRIRQAPYNKIERLSGIQAYASLMASASSFRPFRELAEGWHRTLEGLVAVLPCYVLDCLPDQAAAELCYKTVHG